MSPRDRVESHDRSALAGERVFGDFLHANVEAENQVVAGDGLANVEMRGVVALFIHRPAGGIHEDLA